jgi:hypothetical protein
MPSDVVVQRPARSPSRVLSLSNANRRRSAGSAMNARRHRISAPAAWPYPVYWPSRSRLNSSSRLLAPSTA